MATLVPIAPDPAGLTATCVKAAGLRQAFFALAANVAVSPALLKRVRDAVAAGNGNLSPELHALNDMLARIDAIWRRLGDFLRRYPSAEAYADAATPGPYGTGRTRRLGEYRHYEDAYDQVDEAMRQCINRFETLLAKQEKQP